MRLKLTWNDFKARLIGKNLLPQYVGTTESGYHVWAEEGGAFFYAQVSGDDISDFETNYKAGWNASLKNEYGMQIVAPTLDDVRGLYPKKRVYREAVTAGAINFFDYEIDSEKRINGGEYWIAPGDEAKVHNDDFIEFSIIDKNDVLGLFSYYGLSVANGDILELVKFVQNDLVKKGNISEGYHTQLYEGIKGTNRVTFGLFMRVAYDSHGTENLNFLWRLYFYE